MNDGPYPSTHDTFSRQNNPSARVPAAYRGSDPPRMHLDHTTPRRPAISPHSYSSTSPEMPTMDVYPFSISSHHTLSSPPSSVSAASPTWSMLTMKSDSLEAIDDPQSLNIFNSFIEHSDFYCPTTDDIADSVPSRCSSSQSSASYSTSDSDSSSQISSLFDGPGDLPSAPIGSIGGVSNHGIKLYHCLVCPKSFPRPSGLETHMNLHTGARRMLTAPSLIC
jgi:hypothetical protein